MQYMYFLKYSEIRSIPTSISIRVVSFYYLKACNTGQTKKLLSLAPYKKNLVWLLQYFLVINIFFNGLPDTQKHPK